MKKHATAVSRIALIKNRLSIIILEFLIRRKICIAKKPRRRMLLQVHVEGRAMTNDAYESIAVSLAAPLITSECLMRRVLCLLLFHSSYYLMMVFT